MTFKEITLFSLLLFSSGIISYQDFKSRLISLWAVILFTVCCVSYVLIFGNIYVLINNTIHTIIYFGFIFLVLSLYYFLKEGRLSNIIDSRIGLGDIFIFIAIGLTLDLLSQVVFFAITFFAAALLGIVYARNNKTIPLAGILAICHFCFLVLLQENRIWV